MPEVTLTPVRKIPAKAQETASNAQTRMVKTASGAQSKALKAAGDAQAKAVKNASKAQAKAVKNASKAQAKAVETVNRAIGKPVTRRDKALTSTRQIAGTGARVGAVVVGVWWSAVLSGKSNARRPRAGKGSRIAAGFAGAGAQFLLDPVDGKRRRRMLVDRGSSSIRGLARQGNRRVRYMAGVAKGAAHDATATPSSPADDNTLADRVRTEVFRRADAPKGAVNISVVDGVVYLHGELPRPEDIERLISDARAVPGVRGVESSLHVPGVEAPSAGD